MDRVRVATPHDTQHERWVSQPLQPLAGLSDTCQMFRSPSHFAAHHYGQESDLATIAGSASVTEAAIKALVCEDLDLARRLWQSVDGPGLLTIWNRWNETSRVIGPRWSTSPVEPIGAKSPNLPVSLCRRVYERDGYQCRYCGIAVFRRSKGSPITELIRQFPDLTPGLSIAATGSLVGSGKSGAVRNVDYSKFLWSMVAPEHVIPASLGGPTDESNVITACWGCNAWKGNLTLEQLGVQPPPPK
jgi:5-methylcytosine-specific restriction endonuclease McrA